MILKLRTILFVALLLLSVLPALCQAQSIVRQYSYIEAWGNTGTWSGNYDYVAKNGLGYRLGFTGKPDSEFVRDLGVVGTVNYLIGYSPHKLELGAGGYFEMNTSTHSSKAFYTLTIGYRLVPRESKWMFRIGFTPNFNHDSFYPRMGLSVGRLIEFD